MAGGFKAAQRDTRYAAVIEQAAPPNHPWNTPHVTPVITDEAKALDVQRGVYRSARHAGITAHHVQTVCVNPGCAAVLPSRSPAVHKGRCSAPGWRVYFQLISKAGGRKAIIDHVKGGGALAYNLRR
jgi:hypothetical protein